MGDSIDEISKVNITAVDQADMAMEIIEDNFCEEEPYNLQRDIQIDESIRSNREKATKSKSNLDDQEPKSQSYRSLKSALNIATVNSDKLKEAYDTLENNNDSPSSFIKQEAPNFKFVDQDSSFVKSSSSSVLRFDNSDMGQMELELLKSEN